MNLRDFKKDVDYCVGEFVEDCSLFVALNPAQNSDEIAAVMEDSTNEGAVDGIHQVSTDDNDNHATEIFTPNGIATQTLQKGVNVVKSTSRNGKHNVKKVMK